MPDLTFDFVAKLYERHADALRLVRTEQRALLADGLKAQLDDIEAELTYLLLREYRPETVAEIGCLHGWSTSWILRALRDNGHGHLYSFDLVDDARRHVPAELSDGRWTFTGGDVRDTVLPVEVDYLFVDAAHSGRFARWYLADLVPRLAPGTPISVHDVFHYARAVPFSEGAVVLKWLRDKGIPYFTAAGAHAPDVHVQIMALKQELGIGESVHTGRDNPMIFFALR